MNGKHYCAPQICTVLGTSEQVICTSNVDDMEYRDGEWDSDLVF